MMSNQELERRWTATREVMRQHGLDWLVCTNGHAFGYARWFTGRSSFVGSLVAVPLSGDILLATHGDDVHHPPVDSHGVHHVASCAQPNFLAHTHAPLLLAPIRDSRPRRIGWLGLGFLPAATYIALCAAFPEVEFIDATDLIAPLKAAKSEEEMVALRRAAALHDMAIGVVRNTVRPGVTGMDVINQVRAAVCQAGSPAQTMMAGSAPAGSVCKYAVGAQRRLEPGDQFVMLIECAEADGYYSEAMPTVCLGQVPPALQRAFDETAEVQEILRGLARPGATARDLLEANDAFMIRKGYPPETRLLGHSQGLDLVERPALSPLGENLPLQANMVFSIHPTVHAPTAWGFPVSQSFHITAESTTRMLRVPQEIIVV